MYHRFGKGRKTPVDELGKTGKPGEPRASQDGTPRDVTEEDIRAHREHMAQEEFKWRQAQTEQER
jgi:hypothetical protein